MLNLHDYQVSLKGDDKVSVVIQHVRRIVNNNKSPASWTDGERKNPVIFDKQVQTFLSMTISFVNNKDSVRILSGGNFDFKDSAGPGYFLELKYKENDEAIKEVIKAIREGCGFSCIPGPTSTSCFLADKDATRESSGNVMQEICDTLVSRLGKLKRKHEYLKRSF